MCGPLLVGHGGVHVAVGCRRIASGELAGQIPAADELRQCSRRRVARFGWGVAGMMHLADGGTVQCGGQQRCGQYLCTHYERRRRRALLRFGFSCGRGGGLDGGGLGDHIHDGILDRAVVGMPGRTVQLNALAGQFGPRSQRRQHISAPLADAARVAVTHAAGHLLDPLLDQHRIGGIQPGPHTCRARHVGG